MLQPEQVSAVIVTKGNVDLGPVLESLIFDDVVVWDNSKEAEDQMTFGRVLAVKRAKNRVIYSQDDDIVHSEANQLAILAAYHPCVLTGCMWEEWSDGAKAQGIENGYSDLVFPGSGSIWDAHLLVDAALRYLDYYLFDEFFKLWSDTIVGIIAANQQIDVRFDALPHAEDADRMCNLPDAVALKTEAIKRARYVRDGKWDAHAFYMMEHANGRYAEHRYL